VAALMPMDTKKEKPYFAPQAEGAPPEGEVPSWGEDAAAIAREAGLGSYGPEPVDLEAREKLSRRLDRVDRDLAKMRVNALWLWAVIGILTLIIWKVAVR